LSAPIVSVIIAAHQAKGFIDEAVRSALAQGVVESEILVAPDEPALVADYGFLTALDPRVRVLGDVPRPTGPGLARNRALAAAQGRFIAVLDADDLWSPNYLGALLPLAEEAGAAFGLTRIANWDGSVLRETRPAGDAVGYGTFATAYGSLHGIVRREPSRQWQDVLAEDVLFDLETLALAGGTAPFASDAVYHLRLRQSSLTQGGAFTRDIGAAYDQLINLVGQGRTLVPAAEQPWVIEVFRGWQRMNAAFEAALAAGTAATYQTFVARELTITR
jgi:hypothetical protein